MTEIVHTRKLAELLVDLGVFNKDEVAEIVEIGAQINLPLGRALVLSNRLPEDRLRLLLQIQSLVREEKLDIPSAKRVYDAAKNGECSLSEVLEKLGVATRSVDEKLSHTKLATLLLDAGLVSEEQVEEALKVGYETATPVGRMLVLSGVVNHSVLARALEIQVMLRENKMNHSQAVQLLKSESLRILPVDQNAEQRGLSKKDPSKKIRLGELLILSGILTEGDMLNVLEIGLTTPKPLGDILIDTGLVSEAVLTAALSLQARVSKGELDVRAAASALQEMLSTGKLNENKAVSYDEDELRLGDLLQQSGLVDTNDIEEAISLSTKYPAMIGKMLVVAGSIDEGTLLAAIRSQFLMRNKALTQEEAVQALLYCQRHRLSLDDALDELGIDIPANLRRST